VLSMIGEREGGTERLYHLCLPCSARRTDSRTRSTGLG
jgi:hypothetical protein